MENITWSGREWLTRETWGLYHPNNKLFWYDRNAVEVKAGMLSLKIRKNPRDFDGVFIGTGVGLISSVEYFQYGHFEIECKLPLGKFLWPAFWIYGKDSWPPEIDIFEGYTRGGGNYLGAFFSDFSLWNVQTNAHFGELENQTNTMAGPKTHWFGVQNPARNFLKYKMSWYPDKVVIYYNNTEVRTFRDKALLSQLNSQQCRVIINNSISSSSWSAGSDFQVKYFRYSAL